MNKIILPKTIFGREVVGAMDRLEDDKTPEQKQPDGKAPGRQGYVFIPTINLYVAKQRTLQDLSWRNTHKKIFTDTEIQRQKLRMPTPEETFQIIFYAQQNLSNPDFQALHDDILKMTLKEEWHGEHQNAYFTQEDDRLYVQQAIGLNLSGEPQLSSKTQLEDFLEEDCYVTLSPNSLTRQFLPAPNSGANNQNYIQGQTIMYWHPKQGFVARFLAVSDWAGFDCYRVPDSSDPSLGVRLVAPKAPSLKI